MDYPTTTPQLGDRFFQQQLWRLFTQQIPKQGMNVSPTAFDGVWILEPNLFTDARGYFTETFREAVLQEALQQPIRFVQDNESLSKKGVIRGLHYQLPPTAQSKLVRVVQGKVWDVIVDLRKDSPTFGKTFSIELSADNKKQLFIPQGFAHGYITLSEHAIFRIRWTITIPKPMRPVLPLMLLN